MDANPHRLLKRAEESPLAAGGNPGKHCPALTKCNLSRKKRKMRQRAKTCWSVRPPSTFCYWRSFLCIVHYDWTATKVCSSPNMWEGNIAQREKDGTMRLGNGKTFKIWHTFICPFKIILIGVSNALLDIFHQNWMYILYFTLIQKRIQDFFMLSK